MNVTLVKDTLRMRIQNLPEDASIESIIADVAEQCGYTLKDVVLIMDADLQKRYMEEKETA